MSNYIVGIYDDRSLIKNQELATRYKELTEFFIRHMRSKGEDTERKYIVDKNINGVLNKALELGYDFCIVMAVGNFINSPNFFRYIESWIEKTDFFITGHIIDKESNNSQNNSDGHYWGLHKQCLVVNLKYYKEFGCPNWGDSFADEEIIEVAKANRAKTDIHDDYTPIFLEPTNETQVCTPYVDGWNFINISLKQGLKVYNFHPKIRMTKRYAYPNKSVEVLREQLNWINNILTGATECVFFWNTESYVTVNKLKLPNINKLYSVAAGFKPNFILECSNFTENTEVVYFDYSKQALAFKKLMLEQWDGYDYPNFLYKVKSKYHINETFGASTEGKSYQDLWGLELQNWKNKDLRSHWVKYKKLKHTFIHCDILQNPEKVIKHITNDNNSVIWWSNAFHTVTAHYTKSLEELTNHYVKNWLEPIHDKNPSLIVLGNDYLNKQLEGISIKEELNKYV